MDNLNADVGFGDVKFLFDGVTQKFPTAIVPEPIASSSLNFDEGSAQAYEHNGIRYIVGDAAISAIKSGAAGGNIQRNASWLVGRMPILTQHAAHLAGIKNLKGVNLTIGLPMGDFRQLVGRVEKELSPIFNKVTVLNQGVGVLADHVERNSTPGSGTILDIGFGTAIVLTFLDGKPINAGSGQYDGKGLSEAAKRLSGRLKDLTGVAVSLPEANGFITNAGQFKYQDKNIELSPIVKEALQVYSEEIINLLLSNHDTALSRHNRIILAGGGAYHVERYLREFYSGEVIVPPAPEFANVRGYAYLASGM